jgi:broad specificity phosphatase PhoE
MRLFLLARHARSALNDEDRVNGDPSVPVDLTDEGEREARALGVQLAHFPIDVCIHTRFGRTRRTGELALAGRQVAFREEPLLDDIYVGDLEGSLIADYRAWKRAHTRSDPFPGGESLDDAGRRYAEAFDRLAAGDGTTVLVVCHEIPIRYAINAAAGSDSFDGPVHDIGNAAPFLFTAHALARAAEQMRSLLP